MAKTNTPRNPARPRPPFERIALLLQGGGALGAYQAGVYEALAEADLHPDWIAGISIGAINSALIAGNAPEQRVDRLREFWSIISAPPFGAPFLPGADIKSDFMRRQINQFRALGIMMGGAPGFFTPRLPPPYLDIALSPASLSFYDVAPLKATLERLVDFDRINAGTMRFSVGAVNVRTGNFAYFDNETTRIRAEHILASGALPPGFPAIEIDGEHYWDGGIVSNTPLQWMLDNRPRVDTLAFQVDLWNARGALPRDLMELEVRQKEIRYSSRTRNATDGFKRAQVLRRAAAEILRKLPADLLQTPEGQLLASEANEKVYNIVHLIYRAKSYEGTSKDYEFSRLTMNEHWTSGYQDAVRTLSYPKVLERPSGVDGISTFDLGDPAGT